jgi:nitroreductase
MMNNMKTETKKLNSTLELIEKRRSTRKYDPTPLTDDDKEAILHAAMRAPTAGAMMLYSIIEVEDQAMKDQLVDSCDHQDFVLQSEILNGSLNITWACYQYVISVKFRFY